MGELLEALHSVKQGSAPEPDGITYTALNNLPGETKEELRRIENLGFTIYADDVMLWTKGGSMGDQQYTMQRGIDEVAGYLEYVGMEPSPEKPNTW
ncbi:unnamed protein product, partial [Ixodes hexagonus]